MPGRGDGFWQSNVPATEAKLGVDPELAVVSLATWAGGSSGAKAVSRHRATCSVSRAAPDAPSA